ncbi:MAG: sugar phosphate isomerase/epimerase [Candidatus Pacebacteria bacterium]|nr:sugar phosphate isomerase/epimerase [Candidatus Paceibacterota bacterium]
MKLGFRDLRLFNGDWAALFRFAAQVGAGSLQIDLPRESDRDCLRELIARTGIKLSSITAMSTRLLGPDPEAARQDRGRVERAIVAAAALGAPCVSQFAGHDPARTFDENSAVFREVFTPLAEKAEAAGVTLVFENCPLIDGQPPVVRNLAYCPAAWDAMFAAVPSPAVALELDTAHLPWLGIDIVRCIHDYAGRIRHVHLKDCIIDSDAQQHYGRLDGRFYSYAVPGEGGVDFAAVVSALREAHYEGALTLDLRPTTEDTVRKGMAFMQALLRKVSE